MAKKIFGVYLAKQDAPDSEANVRLKLPASPWELHDAMDKVQLQENEELYLEVDDYYGFEYLAPHLDGSNINLPDSWQHWMRYRELLLRDYSQWRYRRK